MILGALLLSAAGSSATPAVPSITAEEQWLQAQVRVVAERAEQGDLPGGLAAADAALARAPAGSPLEAALLHMRLAILVGLRRDAEVVSATEAILAKGIAVDEGTLTTAADAAARTAQPMQVAALLSAYAERFPGSVNTLRWEFVAAVMNDLHSPDAAAALQSFALALFDAGYRCDSDLGGVEFLERKAIEGLVATGRIAEARPRLAKVTTAANLAGMAVDRRYEPLWSTLEGLLGNRLAPAIDRDLARMKQALDGDPGNLLIRQSYVRKLTWLGNPRRAVELARNILTSPADIAVAGQYGWWLVAAHGDALGMAGEAAAGLQRYRQLNAAIPRGNGARIDTLVDEASFAGRAGLHREAIASADAALATEGVSGFGKMTLWQAKACALHRLGQHADVAPIAAQIEADPTGNRGAYVDAMLCLGRLDRAEAFVLTVLADPTRRMDMLLKLQGLAFDKNDRALASTIDALAARPEVARTIEIYGRTLPAAFRPAY